jgi:(1->4)-alpha-D-glucan 1-alpha-D-glucosylmutase
VPSLRATYRLQLTPTFRFDQAAAVVPYLARLGISHIYTSPIMDAEPGSSHGYDVVDHAIVRAELGGLDGLRTLWSSLATHGLGHVLDIVPNHMSIGSHRNRWWWDVLATGPSSRYADHFDIDWQPPDPLSRERVVLPFLDRHLDEAIADGVLRVDHDNELGPVLRHGGRVWPLRSDAPTEGDLAEILSHQHFRLVHWRDREQLLNYRRFFEIDTLAAVRVDQPHVFRDVHAGLVQLLHDEVGAHVIDGIRVDHVDGITDPATYLHRLRALIGDRWLVVEKILSPGEQLPGSWPVDGTTGYDAGARLTQLFVDTRGEHLALSLAREVAPEIATWSDCVRDAKREHLAGPLRPELDRATRALRADAHQGGDGRDVVVEQALRLSVYRTYDRAGSFDDRFAQLTVALTAKAVEDTALYRWLPLLALNEVGGDPSCFGQDTETVVDELARTAERWPSAMASISTHDSKRSADVRARLSGLSSSGAIWRAVVQSWFSHNQRHRSGQWPDRAIEYFVYQTLVGAWPLTADRLAEHARKAAREAKQRTSWTDPDVAYEDALDRFVRALLADDWFVQSVESFVAPLARAGRITSLAQMTLLLVVSGVPDIYQGDELWNLTLVDPDNRRPVDFAQRQRLLDEVVAIDLAEAWGECEQWGGDVDGLMKLSLIHRLLQLRAERPECFAPGLPLGLLPTSGPDRDHVCALTRGDRVVVIVPRLAADLEGRRPDAGVELPEGRWLDTLSGGTVECGRQPAARLLERFPIAVLVA